MSVIDAEVLFRPETAELRFLPEGPYACGGNRLSWVGIQHGAAAVTGSLNLLDLVARTNRSYDLPGRPGFAFPTADGQSWVIGLERAVKVFTPATGAWRELCGGVDAAVENTIINDATLIDGGLIFGCKDLKFAEHKAGLYLWRESDRRLIQLRRDQICSNGKKVVQRDGQTTLLDIDSPTKTVAAYALDVERGTLGERRVALDLTSGQSFPDGMILTPDGQSVIIAFYDPRDVPWGEARQYRLSDGQVEAVWRTPGSPRATCPQLVQLDGKVRLVLTTAVEHMSAEEAARHPNAGCLFIAETSFDRLPEAPRFGA